MSTQPVKRACDACHRRKVKCDGLNPCRNCGTAQLGCTYNAIPQKKGPKGSRAKVISELRETQRQTSLSTKVQNRMNGIQSPPLAPRELPTPGLVTVELVKDCLDFFFTHMSAQLPILDRGRAEQQLMYMEQKPDAFCMFTALSAFTMFQPGKAMPASLGGDPFQAPPSAALTGITSGMLLIEEVLRVRKGFDYLDSDDGRVSLNTLVTTFFLFACHDMLELHDKAWYYLREATTMALMSNMHRESTYGAWDPVEANLRRSIFWLLFSNERAYAIKNQRPVSLQADIGLPMVRSDSHDPLSPQHDDFLMQVNVFRPFDDKLLASWAKTRDSLSDSLFGSMQEALIEVLRQYHCQDPQLLDLQANASWLKSTAWQLSASCDEAYRIPADALCDMVASLSSHFPQGAGLAGSGLVENLFTVTSTVVDYLMMQPVSRNIYSTSLRDNLAPIIDIVSVVRNGHKQFLPLLMKAVNGVLPKLAKTMVNDPPDDCQNLAEIDIFDGFGNAGMAPLDFEPKFSAINYDHPFASPAMHSMSSDSCATSHSPASSGPSSSEISTHFMAVGSPGIMSPTMDYPPNMRDFGSPPLAGSHHQSMMDAMGTPIGISGGGLGHTGSRNDHPATTPPQINAHITMSHAMNNGLSPRSLPGNPHAGGNPHHIGLGGGGGGGDMLNGMAQQRPLPSMPPPPIAWAMQQGHASLTISGGGGDFPLQNVNPDATLGHLAGMASLDPSGLTFMAS